MVRVLANEPRALGFPSILGRRAHRHLPESNNRTVARVHLCQQLQLSFEARQLSGKFEAATLYRKDLFLQIEIQLYKLGVIRFFIISLIILSVLIGSMFTHFITRDFGPVSEKPEENATGRRDR